MENETSLKDLSEIRLMMERSTRFISLSGLSGIFAGCYALVGAFIVHSGIEKNDIVKYQYETGKLNQDSNIFTIYSNYFFIAAVVLVLSILTGLYFSKRHANKSGEKFWNPVSKRLAINLAIPLMCGALFCIQLLQNRMTEMVAPAMLIFYGLALLNGSKYTLDDIRQLAVCEILLGIIALFIPGYGLYFWAVGFGLLHIIYGTLMHYKYGS